MLTDYVINNVLGKEHKMTLPHWEYFLAIESDLSASTRFVEFTAENFAVYSIEFAHILLSSSSEVDVIAKSLSNMLFPDRSHQNINDYREAITQSFSRFANIEVRIPRYGLSLQPWKAWARDENPIWWKSYNKVKHERNTFYKEANLENALNAVAGLFSLVLFLYRRENSQSQLAPTPTLLTCSIYKIPPNPANVTLENLMEIYRS